jgi:hypothetical protein
MACLIVLLAYLDARFDGDGDRSVRSWLRQNPWALLLFVSVCMLPVSILGRARFGGADNSYHSVHYLILGATVLLAEMAVARPDRRKATTVVLVMMLCSLLSVVFAVPTARELERLRQPRATAHQAVYRYALEHPGTAYFPQFPLSGLLAEGVPYHGEVGVLERKAAGFEPSVEHFRRHIPKDAVYVVFGPDTADGTPWVFDYLPRHNCPTALPEFAGWKVYRKCDSDRQ